MEHLDSEIIYQLLEVLRQKGPLPVQHLLAQVIGAPIFQTVVLPEETVSQLLTLTQEVNWTRAVSIDGHERIELTGVGIRTYYFNKKAREKLALQAYLQAHPFTFQLKPAPGYDEQCDFFAQNYKVIDMINPWNILPSSPSKRADGRVCRFCGKRHPEVPFTQDTHVIPDMLGRNFLYSDFECDNCNNFFGRTYENDLANYLGIARTLTQTKGKEKIPTFTAPGNALKVKYIQMGQEPSIVITREDTTNGAIVTDVADGQIRIKATRNPFTPFKVYKAFLKIALSVLGEKEMLHYQCALDVLLGKAKIMDKGYVMSGCYLPFSFCLPPHAFVFEKRKRDSHIPTHIVAIYFANSVFALPVPLHNEDVKKWRQNPTFQLPLYPPLFSQLTNVTNVPIVPFREDFSSEEVVDDAQQEIIMQIHKDELDKISVYDIATGQICPSQFSHADITRIIMRNNDSPIDPSKLLPTK